MLELPSEDDKKLEKKRSKQAVDFQNLLSINEEIVAWILIHSSMRDCSIESLVMEGTALNGMYFFRTQPKYLRGEKSMSVTLGGAAEEEVENYRSANYAQTECQFRYCGTAIPFLTVRSTAR